MVILSLTVILDVYGSFIQNNTTFTVLLNGFQSYPGVLKSTE